MCVLVATLGVPIAPAIAATPPREVAARPLTPPVAVHPRVSVDMLDVRPQKLSWSHRGSGFVKIFAPGEVHPYPTRFPATGSFTVRTEQLPLGRSTFVISYCKPPAQGAAPQCSAGTPVTYVVGPAEFTGAYRKFVSPQQELQLSWSGSGNVWHLIAPSLGVSRWLTKPSFAIPAADVTPGVHEVSLVSCSFTALPKCSNRFDVVARSAGTVRFTVETGERVKAGQSVGQVKPTRGGPTRTLKAPRAGVFHRLVENGARVRARVAAGRVITADVGRTEIVSGGGASVPTWTKENWRRAFVAQTYDDSLHPSTGSPLDITFDSAGDIWRVGEFSQAIAHVQDGKVTDIASPVGRGTAAAPGTNAATASSTAALIQAGDGPVRNRGLPAHAPRT